MSTNKTSTLYSDFILFNSEFEKFLKTDEIGPDEYCLTLFGVSGAGKSTFLARLKSDKSPKDFYDGVINRTEDRMVVEDVTIGRSVTSVTVVPRLYKIGNIPIYDVPGFKDTDDNRKIIINIFHKCLLNHIKHNKFIAVLKLDLIEEERMTQLIGDYYDAFERLFGKNYRRSIDNVYFVITHFDKFNFKLEDIVAKLKDKIFKAIDLDKDQLTYFLKRLVRKHIVVDYKQDSQEDLVKKLQDLLSQENDNIPQSDLTITNLDVYENELNKRLEKDLEDYIKVVSTEFDNNFEQLKKNREDIVNYVKEKKTLTQTKEQLESELVLVNEFLQNVDKNIELIDKRSQTLKNEITSLENESTAQQAILEVLEKTLKEEVLIHVRVDLPQKGITGSFWMDNTINIDPSMYKDRIILITRFENDDETLKNYFGTGTIIPDNISKVRLFQNDIVLYNNNICLQKSVKVETSFAEGTKELKISVRSDVNFKLYFYYTQELNNNQIYNKTRNHFTNKIKNNKTKSGELTKQIEQNDKEIEALRLKDIERRNKKEELSNKITELSIKIKTLETSQTQLNASTNEQIAKQLKFLSDIKNSELFTIGNNILKIFNKNKLKSSISTQIGKIEKHISESTSKLNNFKENIMAAQK